MFLATCQYCYLPDCQELETMRSYKLVIILLLLLPSTADAQWRGMMFERFDARNGLSSDDIRAICQDSTGFMYFAGYQQLIRYDGHVFEDFTHDPEDPTSIGPGQVSAMLSGRDGRIWMAMRRDGLNVFDPATATFRRFVCPVPHNALSYIAEDAAGNLWMGAADFTLLKFDKTTETFAIYRPGNEVPRDALTASISGIVQDADDHEILWLSAYPYTNPGYPSENQYNILIFHKSRETFTPVACAGNVRYQDSAGQIWGGSWSHGLWRYDSRTGQCRNLRFDIRRSGHIESEDGVFAVHPRPGSIWAGSRRSILRVHDDLSFAFVLRDDAIGGVQAFYDDRAGNTWIGTSNGLLVAHPGSQLIAFYSLAELGFSDRIYPGRLAYHSPSNTIYMTTRNEARVYYIPLDQSLRAGFIDFPERVYSVAVDHRDRILAATGSTVNVVNPASRLIASAGIPGLDELNIDWLWSMTSSGTTIAGISTNDFFWYHDGEEKVKHLHHDVDSTDAPAYGRMFLTMDNRALLSGGPVVHSVDLATGALSTIRTQSFGHLIQDQAGDYWLGTINHIGRYRLEGDSLVLIKYFTTKDGLRNITATHLHPDHRGRIWIFSNSGMSVIDPETYAARNIGVQEGLPLNSIDPVQVIDLTDGRIATVNSNGVIIFHPDSLWHATTPTDVHVVIKNLRIAQEDAEADLYAQAGAHLHLRPSQNTMDIRFQGLAFPDDRHVTYSYRVDGIHSDWVYLAKNNSVTLARLRPGTYTFRVKTGDSASLSPDSRLTFSIATPVYRTWWFMALCLLLLLCIIFFAYRYRLRQIRRKEALKTEMHRQMADLELQALRAQMNPHFMFNSLNSIKNYILRHEPAKAAEYLSSFAHLIRMILQNSRERTVSLKEEIDTLLLYIDLEKLRFRDGFDFTCQVEDRVDIAQVQIPPMIIQPYIENAIWHGLLHKEHDRHLALRIGRDNGNVICEVEDNGIGRAKAAEIKSKSATRYKSMGMGITQDRITLINSMNALGIHVDIIDKTNGSEISAGTLVKISIPDARTPH